MSPTTENTNTESYQFNGQSGKLAKIEKELKFIADELSTDYFTASFGEKEKERAKLEEIFVNHNSNSVIDRSHDGQEKPNVHKMKHRNILVIGTGATYDLYNCIPLGGQLIRDLCKNDYDNKIKVDETRLDKIFKTKLLELGLKPQERSFENTLSLLSQIYYEPKVLRAKIAEFVDFRYPPSLLYEIIAHMFKHSFIDVIINFNFDELLDNAIEEELGKENYFNVLSDGDCVDLNQIVIDGRLKIPVYIKPHGTFKHKSSLRFTNHHYIEMPDPVKELLDSLISGAINDPRNMKTFDSNVKNFSNSGENIGNDEIPVNLICIGFNLDSIEFNDILNERLSARSKIYHFMKEKEIQNQYQPLFLERNLIGFFKKTFGKNEYEEYINNIDKKEQEKDGSSNDLRLDFYNKRKEQHGKVYHRIALELLDEGKTDSITTSLCEIFSYIWRRVYDQFNVSFRPRSIGQHEIISYLFYNPDYSKENVLGRDKLRQNYDENFEYFLDRTLVEIAIAINRNNGIIELAQLLGDRVGKYYALYKEKKASYDRLEINDNKKPKPTLSIYELIDQFKKSSKNDDKSFYPKGVFELDTTILEGDEGIGIKARAVITAIENKEFDLLENELLSDWGFKFDNVSFLKSLVKKFISISIPSPNEVENNKTPFNLITPVVLYYLFTSRHLSKKFKENFKSNYNKIVYNGKNYTDEDLKRMGLGRPDDTQSGLRMLDELVRLFDKSVMASASYYSIHPRFNNPQNFLIETFTPSSILHTNLALEYKFRELFNQTKLEGDGDCWNHLLIISEKTCLFEFLANDNPSREAFRGKNITIINSYEAIKQFHSRKLNEFDKNIEEMLPKGFTSEDLQRAKKEHFKKKIDLLNKEQEAKYEMIFGTKKELVDREISISVSCLPAMNHNHHMMVFVKKTNKCFGKANCQYYEVGDPHPSYSLSMSGALYMYRSGFSNSINPVFIANTTNSESDKPVLNDFVRLLRIFSKIHLRAALFKGLPESEKGLPETEDIDVDFIYQLNRIFIKSTSMLDD